MRAVQAPPRELRLRVRFEVPHFRILPMTSHLGLVSIASENGANRIKTDSEDQKKLFNKHFFVLLKNLGGNVK
jgi:hypothetical protein